MRERAHRILLLALFGLWVLVAIPPLAQQFSTLEQWRARFGDRSMAERAAMVDYPAYIVAEQAKQATPPQACIQFLAYTGPDHVNYYKTRFDYYLYPRRVLISADTGAGAGSEHCAYLAVFRDSPQNLAVEPFRGVWNEDQLQHRLASLEKIHAGPRLEIYRSRR